MDLFESARAVHIGIGVVVLASFWTAALAPKGDTWHRRGGRVYVWAMAALLAATGVMSVGMVKAGTPLRAVFDVYVSLISVASVWMAWSSVRHRQHIQRYLGWPYRVLCLLLGGYALFLLALVPKMGAPARMAMVGAFAVLGLVVAGAMVWRWVRRDDHKQWWLSEHLTAMALEFRRHARIVFHPRRRRGVPRAQGAVGTHRDPGVVDALGAGGAGVGRAAVSR